MFAVLLVTSSLLNAATAAATNLTWWQRATIYQIYPRSFRDSDGDGVGDLKGIIEKVGYLSDLGIAAFWLSPIFPSPMADFGYDVSDFTDVDRVYGTLEVFDELLRAAHEKGLRLILDFVPNHSSDQHPWFRASSDPESADFDVYKDFYVWRWGWRIGDRILPPNNWVSAFGGSAWECDTKRTGLCYLHQYGVQQPDLNYSNPHVLAAMKDVLRFWLDRGVDGVRVDAVRALHEDRLLRDNSFREDGTMTTEHTKNLPESYDVVYQFRSVVDEYPDRVMITEAYGTLEQVLAYCGDGEKEGAHLAFNFFLSTHLRRESTASDFKKVIDGWMEGANARGCWSNWVLGNHDLHRVASRFEPSLVDAFNMLVAALPGTAFTYYGEEIGMSDNTAISFEDGADPKGLRAGPEKFAKASRDFERSPFQWDNSTSAGFSTSSSTWLPVNSDYVSVNVADEQTRFRSHLNVYKRLLSLRREEVMQVGDLETAALSRHVLVLSRRHKSSVIYVLMNLGPERETVDLKDGFDGVPEVVTVIAATGNALLVEGSSRSSHSMILAPFSGIVVSPYDKWTAASPSEGRRLNGACNAVTIFALLSNFLVCHY